MGMVEPYLIFIKEAERLKTVLRSGYTSDGKRESTAAHSWRLALLAGVLLEEFPQLDAQKTLMLALVHDLGELYEGDTPAVQCPNAAEKYETEKQGMQKITALLDSPAQNRLMALWQEYEDGQSPEARFVKALDKAETIIQHNQGNNPKGFDYAFNLQYGCDFFKDSAFLTELRRQIDEDTRRICDENL